MLRTLRTATLLRACLPAALASLLAGAALAEPAAAKPSGQARISVAKTGQPPAAAVAVGDRLELAIRVRNRGRRAARTPLKLIVPKRAGATAGKRLLVKPPKRIKAKSRRGFELRFAVPGSLAPSGDGIAESYPLAACARRHGEGSKWRCRPAERKLRVEVPPLPPGFEPGGRSAGDPLFPQIGNTGYDVRSYDLDLSYNPANNRFRAGTKATVTAVATQNLGRFSLDFQRLDIDSVRVDGARAAYELADATPRLANATQPVKLVVQPPAGIPSGESFSVTVAYSGEPVQITDADGSSEGWVRACIALPTPLTCDGALVVNEPIGAAGWFPNNNVPTDKATYRTAITTPDTHTALGIGELAAKQPLPRGEAKWTWTEDDPTATYLTTATVGRFAYSQGSLTETATGRTLPTYEAIDSIATAPQRSDLTASFDRIGSMIDFLGDRFGPYPFDSAGAIVDNVPTLGYALEVQTKPAFAYLTRDDVTMLHEYAHQWFGNSVSPTTWLDIWFNEGWAEWSAWSWDFEENGNADSPAEISDAEYAAASAADWSIPPATLDGDPANLFDHFATYVRAPMMLEYYRQIVGEAKFFELAAGLQSEFAYGNISTAQFIDRATAASDFTGAEAALLGEFFQQWLYGDVKPTILPASF